MTIETTARLAGPFPGNGATTAFDFAFKVFATSDLSVFLRDADDVDTSQTETTHYTVSLNSDQDSDPGGTVTFVTAPASGYDVYINSAIPLTQSTSLSNAGGFYPAVLNNVHDRHTALIQQLEAKFGRAFLAPVGESGASTAALSAYYADVTGPDNIGTVAEALGDGTIDDLLGIRRFNTLALLLADTAMDYASGTVVEAGDYVTVVDGGYVYTVAASGASDHHVTTAGGVKLYVLPGPKGFNIRAFGALGDGSTDDSAAIQKAWDWILDGNADYEPLHIPMGRFVVNSQVTSTADSYNGSEKYGLKIYGDGPGSVLVNTNSTGCLKWTQASARDVRVHGKDFSIEMAAGGNNGDLLHFAQNPGGLSRQEDLLLENVQIYPADPTTDYYTNGIVATGLYWPTLRNCQIANPYGPGVTTATQHQGTAAFNVENSYGPQAYNCKLWGGSYGVYYDSVDSEGGTFIGNVFDNDIGIYVNSTAVEPGLAIGDNHFNCASKGVHIINRKLFEIYGNIWYNEETTAYEDIDLDNCEDGTIDNITFHFGGNALRKNITVDANCERIQITNTKHRAEGTAIELASGCDEITIIHPYFTSDVDTRIDDNGATNLNVTHINPPRWEGALSSSQSISTESDTVVDWTNEVKDVGGWDHSTTTEIGVPTDLGIKRVRVTVQTSWANNSTGVRNIRLQKNGSVVQGCPKAHNDASLLSELNMSSGIIDCDGGDTFRVLAYQSSGGALNLNSSANTWFKIEAA